MAPRLMLGIESSCDDTAAAVVDEDGHVLSSVIVSQAHIHTQYGGVYPELASRAHIANMVPAIRSAMEDAAVRPSDLHSIGVTRGPGLIGSLLVGIDTARALGEGWHIPVLGINHLRGHLRSADLDERRTLYPATILLVSGGHTFLAHMSSRYSVQMLGSTRDDSVGEAYDKVSRMLGQGYPGGPIVDRMAIGGSPKHWLPRPMSREGLDFSFSGLKTAVMNLIANHPDASPQDIAASFVAACMDVLTLKTARALDMHPSRCLVVVGGVAASPQLRQSATELCAARHVKLSLPPLKWATDNAAMIALAAWDYVHEEVPLRVNPSTTLGMEEL